MSDGVAALCAALQEVGVRCVFGIPGTQNVELFEGFRRSGLRTVLSSHELAAGFMANGYFRASGRVAALATISGPGFTYALTALAEASHDSVPLLHLVVKPATEPGRRFQLQAIDQRAIAAPLVKGVVSLDASADATRVIRAAYSLATSGEPGPVLIELDLARLTRDSGGNQAADATPGSRDRPDIGSLRELFREARRPVLYLGQGAVTSMPRIGTLVDRLRIPVATTPAARGALSEDNELAMGFDPLRGNLAAMNALFEDSDLVLGLGCKLSHNGSAGFALRIPADRFVHVDADPRVLRANYDARLAVVASVEDVLDALEARTAPTEWTPPELRAARDAIRARNGQSEPVVRGRDSMTASAFFSELRRVLPRDAILVTDSGLHQILARRHFDVLAPRGLIFPSDFQSMGYGLPAAIGARIGAPNRAVVALVGDGGFLMSGMELLTAHREHESLITIVFNDGFLNQIRVQQIAEVGHAHATRLANPDFAVLADAFGIAYVDAGVSPLDDVASLIADGRSALVEVPIGDSLPMRQRAYVARGKAIARATLGSAVLNRLKRLLRRG